MLRRHSSIRQHASSHEQQKHSTTTSLRIRPRKRRTKRFKPEVIFKAIVAVEVIFLVGMWSFYTDRLLSSSLWGKLHQDVHTIDTFVDVNDNYASEEEDDVEEKRMLPLWQRQLRQEGRRNRNKEREKHKQQQQMRRELAKIGTLKEIPQEYREPALIIGGSDGSGTRAFARMMLKLGVPMRIDDKESLDVHGAAMFNGQGWPPLANHILNATHSANYKVSHLSNETASTVKQEMQRLKDSFAEWQLKFEQRWFVRQHMNMSAIQRASDAAYGFKAPVTMLLLPLLKDVFGKIKFLHIVRDGRDVALSTNKSPVQKFYSSMYADADERMNKYANDMYPVLAMNLWNDWNTQALEWEQAHETDPDFDFLVMRSEDLVDPSCKFETLARLAAFVGSPKTPKELCCMSREDEVDMGKSLVSSNVAAGDYTSDRRIGGWHFGHKRSPQLRQGRVVSDGGRLASDEDEERLIARNRLQSFFSEFHHGGLLSDDSNSTDDGDDEDDDGPSHRRLVEESTSNTQDVVHSRYGKWRELLKNDPELSALLHQEGAPGLATFGYEPAGSFMDPETSPVKNFVCDDSVICEGAE